MSARISKTLLVLLTCLLTLTLLIGGSFIYEKLFYTQPLEAAMTEMDSIDSFQVVNTSSRSNISVTFTVEEKLRTSFYLLLDQLEAQNQKKQENIKLEIINLPNKELEAYLRASRLPIFEAISTGQFTKLQLQLEQISLQQGISYDLEVDHRFIFLTATKDQQSAHVIINRDQDPLNIINTMGGATI